MSVAELIRDGIEKANGQGFSETKQSHWNRTLKRAEKIENTGDRHLNSEAAV